MASRSSMGPLEPVLRHVEEELSENLARACQMKNVREEATGELERLAETLSQAAQQARAAAALRRRMRTSDVAGTLADRLVSSTYEHPAVRPRVSSEGDGTSPSERYDRGS